MTIHVHVVFEGKLCIAGCSIAHATRWIGFNRFLDCVYIFQSVRSFSCLNCKRYDLNLYRVVRTFSRSPISSFSLEALSPENVSKYPLTTNLHVEFFFYGKVGFLFLIHPVVLLGSFGKNVMDF